MAVTATTVRNQIETTIKAITPTVQAAQKYVLFSDNQGDIEDDAAWSGSMRAFEVWIAEGAEGDYHHPAEFKNAQWFDIGVAYPAQEDLRALDAILASDRHDLKAALDNQTNWGTDVFHQALMKWDEPIREKESWVLRVRLLVEFAESST